VLGNVERRANIRVVNGRKGVKGIGVSDGGTGFPR